ncbi:MAG: hypothetical protein JOY78_03350 [Pseudonocardia sp.]|nr:hypothetical protein [Pseudonocardia sp.]
MPPAEGGVSAVAALVSTRTRRPSRGGAARLAGAMRTVAGAARRPEAA